MFNIFLKIKFNFDTFSKNFLIKFSQIFNSYYLNFFQYYVEKGEINS